MEVQVADPEAARRLGDGLLAVGHDTFQVGDLTAVIGDNEIYDGRRPGYNGIHKLVHKTRPESLFGITGLNLEHIFDGDQDLKGDTKTYFEPRNSPMTFTKISDSEAELHQPQTPTFFLESWTRFKLVAPHYIDFSFRCKPHQHAFRNGYIGLFWASYIEAPENKSMYFRDDKGWVQLCTQGHNDESTVRYKTPGHSMLLVQAGTASSSRTRGETNSCNIIRIDRPHITIERLAWDEERRDFAVAKQDRFELKSSGWARAA